MSVTAKLMNVVENGLKRLEAFQIATLLICTRDGKPIDVEHATEAEFQQFVNNSGIRVKDNGIAEWSFADRCGFIQWARKHGRELNFLEVK